MVFGGPFQPKLLYCILWISLVCCGGTKEWPYYTTTQEFLLSPPDMGSYLFYIQTFCICLLTGYESIPELSHLQTPWKNISIWRLSNYHSPGETEARWGLVVCIDMHTHITLLQNQMCSMKSYKCSSENWSQGKMLLTCKIQNKACQECKVIYVRRWKKLLQPKPHLTLSCYWSSHFVANEKSQSSWDGQ